jgi:hypothetical protein
VVRGIVAVLLLLLASYSRGVAAWAADEPATAVIVHVRNAGGDPVSARVLIVGTSTGQSYQRVTDRVGSARVAIRPGRYWVSLEARGYQNVRKAIDLVDGDVQEITFTVVDLEHIGSVRSRADVARSTSTPASPARRISANLAEAMNSVAGVSASGGEGGLGIRASFQGGDESLTRFGMGGAPLPANAAVLAVNTDLIETVQIDQSRELVQFGGLPPTRTPVYRFRARTGSYGAAFESASFQDTFGETGVAILHTLRAQESPLNGAAYRDTSGESYRHVGALHTTGDYFKVTGPLGSWAGSAETSGSRNAASPLATYLAGRLPVGTGPGETKTTAARNSVFTLNGALASNSVALTYAEFATASDDRQADRLVDGRSFPYAFRLGTFVSTFSATIERGVSEHLTADAAFQVFDQKTTADLGGVSTVAAERTDEASLSLQHGDRQAGSWSAEYKAGHVGGLGYGSFEVRTRRTFNGRVSVAANASTGTIAQSANDARRARGWLDPYAADFNCDDRTIVTEGPGDVSAVPHRTRIFGSVSAQVGKVHASASTWYARTRGQLMTAALVPLRPEDSSMPGGYIGDLLHEAVSPTRCGPGGEPFVLFGRRDVAGQSVTDRGYSASFTADRGALHAELSLELVSARLDSTDRRLQDPKSFYVPGRQILGVPPFRATLLLDRTLGRSAEMLASVHYEATNNSHNLPAFVSTAIGISRRVGPTSTLTIMTGNAFNAFAGTYVSSRYALPVRTADGTLLRGVAAPLSPFRISAQYDLSLTR